MPIRFRCRRCNVLLSISSRKAGSEIKCPKCSVEQTVPAAEAAVSVESTLAASEPVTTDTPSPTTKAADSALKSTSGSKPPVVVKEPATAASAPAADEDSHDEPLTVTVYEEVYDPAEAVAPSGTAPTASATLGPTLAASATETPTAKAEPAPQTEAAKRETLAAEMPLAPLPALAAPVPGGMILYRRRTLYIHGALFALLAFVGFGAGYLVGRGNATLHLQAEQEEARRSRVLVEGLLTWRPEPKEVAADENAVVIALPEGKAPPKLIPMVGLRPVDPPPGEFHKGVKAIKDLGGDFTRADAHGKFALVVPDQGRYRLLMISRHAGRGGDETFSEEADLKDLRGYFQSPELLVGRYKYRWTSEEIKPGFNPIEFNFGEDGK